MIPQMNNALNGWLSDITIDKLTIFIQDFQAISTKETILFQGVVQPYKPSELEIQAAGNRIFAWIRIHTITDLIIKPQDKIIYNNKQYKVWSVQDYSMAGYYEYTCIEDFVAE